MGIVRFLTFTKDVVVAGAKGFWDTPVDIGIAKAKRGPEVLASDGAKIGRGLIGDPSVVCDRPDIWAAYKPSET